MGNGCSQKQSIVAPAPVHVVQQLPSLRKKDSEDDANSGQSENSSRVHKIAVENFLMKVHRYADRIDVLRYILSNEKSKIAFTAFLKSEYSEENLYFFQV